MRYDDAYNAAKTIYRAQLSPECIEGHGFSDIAHPGSAQCVTQALRAPTAVLFTFWRIPKHNIDQQDPDVAGTKEHHGSWMCCLQRTFQVPGQCARRRTRGHEFRPCMRRSTR